MWLFIYFFSIGGVIQFFSNTTTKIISIVFVVCILTISICIILIILKQREDYKKPQSDDILILHMGADGRAPYDWFSNYIAKDTFKRAIYGSLTSMTQNGLFITNNEDSILEKIETENGDPSKLIFTIKKNQYFSFLNEKIEATSEDLMFSYTIPFFSEKNEMFQTSELTNIIGSENIKPDSHYNENSSNIKGLTILNKYSLKIELKQTDSNIIRNLSTSKYPIISKHFYFDPRIYLPIGLGKYEFIPPSKENPYGILKRKNKLKNYPTFIKYVSTEDFVGDILWKDMWGEMRSPYKKEIIRIPYGTLGLFFNYNTDFGKNLLFRKAISLAIDRADLCDGISHLIPNSQTLPHGYWGRIDTIDEVTNIGEAKKIISSIKGLPDPFIINVFGQTRKEIEKPYFVKLKSQLKSIGLNPKFVLDRGSGDQTSIIIIVGLAVPYKDPVAVFNILTNNSILQNGPMNDEIIKNFLQKLNTSNLDTEKLLYAKKLSEYIYNNKIFVPLWDLLTVFLINQDKIETLGNQIGGMVFDISKIKVK